MPKEKFIFPAVSIIIPLYNDEEYVGEYELHSDRKQLTLAQRRIAELEAELRRAN